MVSGSKDGSARGLIPRLSDSRLIFARGQFRPRPWARCCRFNNAARHCVSVPIPTQLFVTTDKPLQPRRGPSVFGTFIGSWFRTMVSLARFRCSFSPTKRAAACFTEGAGSTTLEIGSQLARQTCRLAEGIVEAFRFVGIYHFLEPSPRLCRCEFKFVAGCTRARYVTVEGDRRLIFNWTTLA